MSRRLIRRLSRIDRPPRGAVVQRDELLLCVPSDVWVANHQCASSPLQLRTDDRRRWTEPRSEPLPSTQPFLVVVLPNRPEATLTLCYGFWNPFYVKQIMN